MKVHPEESYSMLRKPIASTPGPACVPITGPTSASIIFLILYFCSIVCLKTLSCSIFLAWNNKTVLLDKSK